MFGKLALQIYLFHLHLLIQGALLVNISRGGLLDYEAVLYHLESGHLGGLGIDVAWTEPFDPDDPILKFKNVLITPHIGGVTEHSYRSMAKVCTLLTLLDHLLRLWITFLFLSQKKKKKIEREKTSIRCHRYTGSIHAKTPN
jgi:lactate dehydrogenase-like 2-hydroxyacid dehydrogenase